jgi:hypothetical protein
MTGEYSRWAGIALTDDGLTRARALTRVIKALIEHYAPRMTIEQRLAEIIQGFRADAPIIRRQPQRRPRRRAVRASPGTHRRLPSPAARQLRLRHPDTLQRRFLDTPGEIITSSIGITVKITRRT